MNKTISAVKDKAKALGGKVKYAVAAASIAAANPAAFCDGDATTTLNNVLKMVFTLLTFGGIIFTAYGVVLIAKSIAAPDGQDSHGLSKGISVLIGGILMIVAQPILTALGVSTTINSITG